MTTSSRFIVTGSSSREMLGRENGAREREALGNTERRGGEQYKNTAKMSYVKTR